MPIIRKKEIQRFNEQELNEKKKDLELELLKMSAQQGQSAGTSKKIKEIKRTIARINTQLNQIKPK
ncbi:MAG: 50S ribosomal protein L29 [Candidatus Pacearchaeota archaeon]